MCDQGLQTLTLLKTKTVVISVFLSLLVDGLLTHLTKLRKVRISKQGNVSDELVNNVGFRSVHRSATVADVLSRVEHSERKAG